MLPIEAHSAQDSPATSPLQAWPKIRLTLTNVAPVPRLPANHTACIWMTVTLMPPGLVINRVCLRRFAFGNVHASVPERTVGAEHIKAVYFTDPAFHAAFSVALWRALEVQWPDLAAEDDRPLVPKLAAA